MAYTGTSALSFDQTAWNTAAYFALRPELYFDAVADVEPTDQAMPGAAVTFVKVADMAENVTPLSETTDVTATALSDSTLTLTLAEYGDAVITTAKLRGTSFLDLDPVVANVLGFQAGISVDALARDVLKAGTNVAYGGNATARANVNAADTIDAADCRTVTARFREDNVATIGGMYVAFMHPRVSVDLRTETGAAAWRDPHTYSQPGEIWNGEIGAFEGTRFIETPRAPKFAAAGGDSPANDVYATIFLGRQALAKAYSYTDGNGPTPRIVPGPVTDTLRRLVPMGWYWLGAYGRFREEAIRRVESGTSN